MLTKIVVKTAKPRNPFVAPSLRRMAGSHRLRSGAQRQRAARALRQELDHLRPSP